MSEMKTIAFSASTLFTSPQKERECKSMLDNFSECIIHRTANGFYITDKQRPVLKKIHVKLVHSVRFMGNSLSTLRKC